jgi:hypothetical protein
VSSSPSTNGTSIKSFADLGLLIDLNSLPDGPSETAVVATESQVILDSPSPSFDISSRAQPNLPVLLAQLAEMSSGLEAMARQDARARELATVELARYEALLADRRDAERALDEARQVRAAAEQFVAQAFTDELRTRVAEHVATARAAELTCAELLAVRVRQTDELASRPHLARLLAERERQVKDRVERERRRDAERAERLAAGLEQAREALRQEQPEQALRVLQPLRTQFPDAPELRRTLDAAYWQLRRRVAAPVEEALHDVRSRAYRLDPERAMTRLAGVEMDGVPEDLARQLFGIWSDVCLTVVKHRGWNEPLRDAPETSRGVVFARPTLDGSYAVLSALGRPEWHEGQVVEADALPKTARPLQERRRSAAES